MAVGDVALVWTIWKSTNALFTLEYPAICFFVVTMVIVIDWLAESRPTKQTVPGLAVAVSDGN